MERGGERDTVTPLYRPRYPLYSYTMYKRKGSRPQFCNEACLLRSMCGEHDVGRLVSRGRTVRRVRRQELTRY
jgi:hypothetical protein